MNEFIAHIILEIVQGLSEWLPISSSGHLVLFSHLLGLENSMQFDVAVHFGTLMAVFVYFGRDICDIFEAILKGKWKSEKAVLGWMVALGTIPAAIIGLLFKSYFEAAFESLWMVGIGFFITAMVLFIASFDMRGFKEMPGWKGALFIGLCQAIAILPGVSRSGSTLASGLASKLSMKSALRFSFLLAIPAVFGASILELGSSQLPSELILPTFVSFLVGLLTIHLMFNYLLTTAKSLKWFALYELIIAIITLLYAWIS